MDHVHGPECTETVQRLANIGEVRLAQIWVERDHFISDSDLLDVADELVPIGYSEDNNGNAVPITWDDNGHVLTGFDAELAHLIHMALLNELDWRVFAPADTA